MLVSNLVVDILLFGALLLGGALDSFVPALHGVATLLAVGGATYIAAQEISATLDRRGQWTQESLWTSVALCVAGFIYYWWRNQSDLILLALSIGLMMASLMIAIAIISAVGAALRDGGKALGGFVFSALGSLLLGGLAGALILALSQPANTLSFVWKIGLVALSAIAWKWREKSLPEAPTETVAPEVAANTTELPTFVQNIPGVKGAPQNVVATPTHAQPTLVPQNGTVFDRLGPALVLGAVLLFIAANGARLAKPISTPAVAGTPISGTPAP